MFNIICIENLIYHKKFARHVKDRSHGEKNGRKTGKTSSIAVKDAVGISLEIIYINSLKSQLFESRMYPHRLYTIYNLGKTFLQDNPSYNRSRHKPELPH